MSSNSEHAAMIEIQKLLELVASKDGQVSFSHEERNAFDQIGELVAQFQVEERAELDRLLEMTDIGRATLADRHEREKNASFSTRTTISPRVRELLEVTELGRTTLRDIDGGH